MELFHQPFQCRHVTVGQGDGVRFVRGFGMCRKVVIPAQAGIQSEATAERCHAVILFVRRCNRRIACGAVDPDLRRDDK